MLVDRGLLANGSVNSFITGKHFNRCRKTHPILSLALQILYFNSFLQNYDFDVESTKLVLLQFSNEKSTCPKINDEKCKDVFEKYEEYKKETLEGKHGKTPQFFMMYVRLVEYYLMLE